MYWYLYEVSLEILCDLKQIFSIRRKENIALLENCMSSDSNSPHTLVPPFYQYLVSRNCNNSISADRSLADSNIYLLKLIKLPLRWPKKSKQVAQLYENAYPLSWSRLYTGQISWYNCRRQVWRRLMIQLSYSFGPQCGKCALYCSF